MSTVCMRILHGGGKKNTGAVVVHCDRSPLGGCRSSQLVRLLGHTVLLFQLEWSLTTVLLALTYQHAQQAHVVGLFPCCCPCSSFTRYNPFAHVLQHTNLLLSEDWPASIIVYHYQYTPGMSGDSWSGVFTQVKSMMPILLP